MTRLQDDEKEALSSYFFSIGVLPGSGEFCLHDVLLPGAMAKRPLLDRVPDLKVPAVSFLYGQSDWMSFTGGVEVQEAVERGGGGRKGKGLNVDVRIVEDAGHLLNIENPDATNASIVAATEGETGDFRLVDPADVDKEKNTWTRRRASNRI